MSSWLSCLGCGSVQGAIHPYLVEDGSIKYLDLYNLDDFRTFVAYFQKNEDWEGCARMITEKKADWRFIANLAAQEGCLPILKCISIQQMWTSLGI